MDTSGGEATATHTAEENPAPKGTGLLKRSKAARRPLATGGVVTSGVAWRDVMGRHDFFRLLASKEGADLQPTDDGKDLHKKKVRT